MRGILICLLAFAAGMGCGPTIMFMGGRPSHLPAPPQAVSRPIVLAKPAPVPVPAAPVIATVPGPRYVHRGGSDLRDKPKISGHVLKKEAKGAKVILEALEDGGWARVTDGNITGHMRASILGVEPPQ
jgi:hypothetical protein